MNISSVEELNFQFIHNRFHYSISLFYYKYPTQLTWGWEEIEAQLMVLAYSEGFLFDCIHLVVLALFLAFGNKNCSLRTFIFLKKQTVI